MSFSEPFMVKLYNHGLKPTIKPIVRLTPEGLFDGVTPPVKAFNVIHTSRNANPTVRLEPTPLLVDTFKHVVVHGKPGPLGHGLEGVKALFLQGYNKGSLYEDSTLFRFYTALVKRVEQAMPLNEKKFAQVHTPFNSWHSKPLKTSTSFHHDSGSNTVALHYGEQHGLDELTGLPVVKMPIRQSGFHLFNKPKTAAFYVALEPRHMNDAFGLYHNHTRYGTPHGAVTPVILNPEANEKLKRLDEKYTEVLNDNQASFEEFKQSRNMYYDKQITVGKELGVIRKLNRYEPLSPPKLPPSSQSHSIKKRYDETGMNPQAYHQFRNPYTRKAPSQSS
jgi:hypothetical protein